MKFGGKSGKDTAGFGLVGCYGVSQTKKKVIMILKAVLTCKKTIQRNTIL
jgi:hypothetical protein